MEVAGAITCLQAKEREKATFTRRRDSLAAFAGCESARGGPRESLLLPLSKFWLSGGCFSSPLRAGGVKVCKGWGVRAQSPRLLVMPSQPGCSPSISPPGAPQSTGRKRERGRRNFPGFEVFCIPSHRNFWARWGHFLLESGRREGSFGPR